jgi:choline dehydrogenase-like flavoprotein
MQKEHRILSGTSALTPFSQAKGETPAIKAWSEADPRKSEEKFFGSFPKLDKDPAGSNKFMMATRIEQAPNPDSRVTLDTERDALGMPRAVLNWALTPLEKHSIRTIYRLIGRQLGAAGIGRVQMMEYLQDNDDHSWPDFTGGGWHHMGTTRMSDDPNTGVVDADCKVHGIANLFLAGSGCYVTAAAPNPTLTIVALSLRLSDHLKALQRSPHR